MDTPQTTSPLTVPPVAQTVPSVPQKLPLKPQQSNKKFILGCFGALGCSLFLFIAVVFAFLAFGSTNNPIFSFFGVAPAEVYNVIFSITNLVFLVLVFLTFIFVIVGVFKRITARKDDAGAKKNGNIIIFIATVLLIFFVVSWVFAYFFLVNKRTSGPRRDPIITQPARTINLTAPVTVAFNGSQATLGRTDVQVLSYEWDFGDGSKARGDNQTHTYETLGNFKAQLTLHVKNRQTGVEEELVFTHDVTIDNILATIVIKANPKQGPAPLSVTFDASETRSENGEITDYGWDFDGDGEFDDSSDAIASYTFDQIKEYTVSLRVTDSSGQTADSSIVIDATESDDPTANIEVDGVEGTELTVGESYIFSGNTSISPKGTIEKYTWEFSDGTTAQTRTIKHSFSEPGTYDVTLKVTDSTKRTAEKTLSFKVNPASRGPIIAVISEPATDANDHITGEIPLRVNFDATGSTDQDDSIVEYTWDFDGDGRVDDTNPISSFTYTEAGTYTATVTIIDSANHESEKKFTVTVLQQGLRVDVRATPISGSSPLKVNFDASASSYPEGKIVSYEWDFGDGSRPRIDTAKIMYQYNRIGTFKAKVTAITDDNKRDSATLSISVRPISLNACFDASIEEGSTPLSVNFDSLCSTGTVVRYAWDFGGLKKSNERRPTFTFVKPGNYEVTLEVRDTEDVIDTFSKIIIVK